MGNFLFKAGAIIFLCGFIPCIIGFGPIGIIAETCAAHMQSEQGNVEAGSCFSCCTSHGMRGHFINFMIIGIILLYIGYLLGGQSSLTK